MARKKRFFRRNHLHHVMFRGVNGRDVFLDDNDCVCFCLLLQAACEKHTFAVHGFCFMTNHIHLILEPLKESFQSGIHAFSFRYAQYFNHRHKRRGYLFQGRYKSILVEDETYLKRLIRYIHLNPVEANLVKHPEDFRWSSFRGYLGQDYYVWLTTNRILRRFGETRQAATQALVVYTHQKLEAESDLDIVLEGFRKGVLGSEDLHISERSIQNEDRPSLGLDLSLDETISHLCRHFEVTFEDLSGQSKSKHVVDARSVLAFLSRQTKAWSLEILSVALNKNSGTLSRLATRAEKMPELTSVIEKLMS